MRSDQQHQKTRRDTVATKTTDTRSAAELEAAIVDGDCTVTIEHVEAARRRERYGELQDQAAVKQAARDAEAHRREQVAALAAEVEAMPQDADRVRELAATAHGALVELLNTVSTRRRAVAAFANRARQLGVPSRPEDDPASPVVVAGDGRQRTLHVHGRRVGDVDPATLLARLVVEAQDAHGTTDVAMRTNTHRRNLRTVAAQLADLERPAR